MATKANGRILATRGDHRAERTLKSTLRANSKVAPVIPIVTVGSGVRGEARARLGASGATPENSGVTRSPVRWAVPYDPEGESLPARFSTRAPKTSVFGAP